MICDSRARRASSVVAALLLGILGVAGATAETPGHAWPPELVLAGEDPGDRTAPLTPPPTGAGSHASRPGC